MSCYGLPVLLLVLVSLLLRADLLDLHLAHVVAKVLSDVRIHFPDGAVGAADWRPFQ